MHKQRTAAALLAAASAVVLPLPGLARANDCPDGACVDEIVVVAHKDERSVREIAANVTVVGSASIADDLATPVGGIDDVYVSLGYRAGAWDLAGIWPDFSTESGGGNYGNELDLSAGRSLGSHYGILLKAAFVDGDAPAFADTTKLWLQLTADF